MCADAEKNHVCTKTISRSQISILLMPRRLRALHGNPLVMDLNSYGHIFDRKESYFGGFLVPNADIFVHVGAGRKIVCHFLPRTFYMHLFDILNGPRMLAALVFLDVIELSHSCAAVLIIFHTLSLINSVLSMFHEPSPLNHARSLRKETRYFLIVNIYV